jgi:hypothetical protein
MAKQVEVLREQALQTTDAEHDRSI